MATGAIRGRRAGLLITPTTGSNRVYRAVRNWSITNTQEMLDASNNDSSGWNEYIPGQRGWVFRAEQVYGGVSASPSANGTDIRDLVKAMTAGGGINIFRLAVNVASTNTTVTPTSASGRWQSGSSTGASVVIGRVTNYRVGGSYNDIVLFDFEITGSGRLNYSS